MPSTSVAVGCAVGVPCFVALCVAFVFFVKTRRRFKQEDKEYALNEVGSIDKDLSYNNIGQLRLDNKKHIPASSSTEPSEISGSEDGREKKALHPKPQTNNHEEDTDGDETQNSTPNSPKRKRYVPAYKKKLRSSVNLSNSRNSSFSNLNNFAGAATSNSSINSSNTVGTDNFYGNVPVMDDNQNSSSRNSFDLARSLQQPTPSYSKKNYNSSKQESKINRSPSFSTSQLLSDEDIDISREYDLKNNYNLDNDHEIQEEDQYENEFSNYSENKRAYIEGLRPKAT